MTRSRTRSTPAVAPASAPKAVASIGRSVRMTICCGAEPAHRCMTANGNGRHSTVAASVQLAVSSIIWSTRAGFGTPQCNADANSRRRVHTATKPSANATPPASTGSHAVVRDANSAEESRPAPNLVLSWRTVGRLSPSSDTAPTLSSANDSIESGTGHAFTRHSSNTPSWGTGCTTA